MVGLLVRAVIQNTADESLEEPAAVCRRFEIPDWNLKRSGYFFGA